MELITRTSQIVSQTYLTMPIYIACAGVFILLNYAGMKGLYILENRLAIPGFGGNRGEV
jgi:polar amino acid transport system permease protein